MAADRAALSPIDEGPAGLLRAAPPAWSPPDQAWLISRYADIQAVLRHPRVAVAEPGAVVRSIMKRVEPTAHHLPALLDAMAIFQNGAAHKCSRAALRRYTTSLADRWSEAAMERLVREEIARLETGRSIEAVSRIADAIPNAIAAAALGLDRQTIAVLRRCGQAVMDVWRPVPPVRQCREVEPVAERIRTTLRASPRNSADRIALSLDREEAVADLEFFILTAVVETTAAALGNGIWLIAAYPELQEYLRCNPDLVPQFVDEALRLRGPIRRLNRRVAETAIKVGGQALPMGAAMLLVIETAHRDPATYSEPDRIDLHRGGPPLLVFGGGRHACLGPGLARLELATTLRCLIERFRVAAAAPPTASLSMNLRQFQSLPIILQ